MLAVDPFGERLRLSPAEARQVLIALIGSKSQAALPSSPMEASTSIGLGSGSNLL